MRIVSYRKAMELGCGCQWARIAGSDARLHLTVPGCRVDEHAADARKRIDDPGGAAENWESRPEQAERAAPSGPVESTGAERDGQGTGA